jgi:hypothetical protein
MRATPFNHAIRYEWLERFSKAVRNLDADLVTRLEINAAYTAEEKVAILRRHLLDKGLQPTVFYRWQKEFFENGAAAFRTPERPRRQAEEKQKRIEFLEKKVQTKDEVLAELMAEHIALKTSLGEL